jgi:hypothetical protein
MSYVRFDTLRQFDEYVQDGLPDADVVDAFCASLEDELDACLRESGINYVLNPWATGVSTTDDDADVEAQLAAHVEYGREQDLIDAFETTPFTATVLRDKPRDLMRS